MPRFEPGPAAPVVMLTANAWGKKALEGECDVVARAANGTRNDSLNRAAFNLGQLVGGGHLDEAEVQARLFATAEACGLVAEDGAEAARATIDSGLKAGNLQPRHPKDRPHPMPGRKAPDVSERRSAFYSAATLAGKPIPARQWLVAGLVPMRTVTLFSGDGGTGKSLLALQLAVAAVTGGTWLGREVKPGRVIFLSAEDDDEELHRRLADVLRSTGGGFDDLAGLTLRSLAGEDALLAVDTQIALIETELFAELEARAADEGPALIIIDTLADTFPANENDRAKVRQFIGILRGLSLRQKCAVMLLGHPSLTGLNSGTGTSGSTAWNNSVRSRLYLERIIDKSEKDADYERDPDKRVLSTKKANHAQIGGVISLTWREGVFVADEAETSLDKMAATAKGERVFLKLLREVTAQGRRVNASGGLTYAPKAFVDHPDREGMTKRALKVAMETLLANGKVKVVHGGSPARPVTWLEVAE